MIQRHIRRQLLSALSDTPVVLLHGARQCGKTTLVRSIAEQDHPARYFTLDDRSVLSAALNDPQGFVDGIEGPVVIDEVQRAPALFLAIKAAVDRNRTPGKFLLTGSANILLLPKLSETLAGRMEILQLWSLSQGEVAGLREDFVERVFTDDPQFASNQSSDSDLIQRVIRGGFPEAVKRTQPERRDKWFESYLTTLIQRDVRDLANIEGLNDLPRLLRLLSSRTASLQNISEISRSIGFPQTTLKRYLSLLEASFLIQHLPAWSINIGKRSVKASKLFFSDTGVLCHLLGADEPFLTNDRKTLGIILENLVMMQLRKEISWNSSRVRLHHFRTHSGREVDFVLENPRGELVGIEVKSSVSIKENDMKGLQSFASMTGDRFFRGIVLYTGDQPFPISQKLMAAPISNLWTPLQSHQP